jgi:hypothetical protein
MERHKSCTPSNNELAQQAIHWINLATQENVTIIIIKNPNWYNNQTTHSPLYKDTHVIAYIKPDTMTYETPLFLREQITKLLACIHIMHPPCTGKF